MNIEYSEVYLVSSKIHKVERVFKSLQKAFDFISDFKLNTRTVINSADFKVYKALGSLYGQPQLRSN